MLVVVKLIHFINVMFFDDKNIAIFTGTQKVLLYNIKERINNNLLNWKISLLCS